MSLCGTLSQHSLHIWALNNHNFWKIITGSLRGGASPNVNAKIPLRWRKSHSWNCLVNGKRIYECAAPEFNLSQSASSPAASDKISLELESVSRMMCHICEMHSTPMRAVTSGEHNLRACESHHILLLHEWRSGAQNACQIDSFSRI